MTGRVTTLSDLLADTAAAAPESTVVIDGGPAPRRVSRSELVARVLTLREDLRAHGVGEGDCVGVWLPNWSESLVAQFAAAALGAHVIGINTRYGVADVAHVLDRARPRVLLIAHDFLGLDLRARLREAVAEADVPAPGIAVVTGPGRPPADEGRRRDLRRRRGSLGAEPAVGRGRPAGAARHPGRPGRGVHDLRLDRDAEARRPPRQRRGHPRPERRRRGRLGHRVGQPGRAAAVRGLRLRPGARGDRRRRGGAAGADVRRRPGRGPHGRVRGDAPGLRGRRGRAADGEPPRPRRRPVRVAPPAHRGLLRQVPPGRGVGREGDRHPDHGDLRLQRAVLAAVVLAGARPGARAPAGGWSTRVPGHRGTRRRPRHGRAAARGRARRAAVPRLRRGRRLPR
ncbi:hypothetical protein L7F22_048589 [Adiantum nelumboides]|nr:hypothetical protein [Adiantum nelumboides]